MTTHAMHSNLRSENRSALLRLAAQMAEEMERIGGRMRERREELGLKQREVAERIPGKTEGKDVSRWERGKHRPASDTLDLIAEALETDVADLYAGPLSKRRPKKSKGGEDLLGQFSAQAADAETGKALKLLGEQLAGVELAVQGVATVVEQLAEDVKSVQADLATLKRRKAG